jgi:hypothetical protein
LRARRDSHSTSIPIASCAANESFAELCDLTVHE